MLEDVALQYTVQSEDTIKVIWFGLWILGGIFAAVIDSGEGELQRAPYFAFSMLIFASATTTQLLWIHWLKAAAGGYIWVLLVVDVMSAVAAGFFTFRIATARSRDVYGNSSGAKFAFIPLANLVLFFARSRAGVPGRRIPTIRLLTGGAGVFTGFALVILAACIKEVARHELARQDELARTEPEMLRAMTDVKIRTRGLESYLSSVAAEAQTPLAIDADFTLTRMEARGTTLEKTYEIDFLLSGVDFQRVVEEWACSDPVVSTALLAGASITEIYEAPDGVPIATIVVNGEACVGSSQ